MIYINNTGIPQEGIWKHISIEKLVCRFDYTYYLYSMSFWERVRERYIERYIEREMVREEDGEQKREILKEKLWII